MIDTRQLLERQAQWQKGRQALSWPEKIRMAQNIRDSVEAFRSDRERYKRKCSDSVVRRLV